jgi:hypothetical protein
MPIHGSPASISISHVHVPINIRQFAEMKEEKEAKGRRREICPGHSFGHLSVLSGYVFVMLF